MPRIYLDNAATTWPKPEAVYSAVDRYLRQNGATAGRGVYREAVESDRLIETARARLARLINAPSPECIVFTLNCTDALNIALRGFLKSGHRVVTTDTEHNSILRPLHFLQEEPQEILVTYVPTDDRGVVEVDGLRHASNLAQLVAIQHASNVTGAIQPLAPIAELAKANGAKLLVDAAQTAGALPVDVQALGIDMLAAAGHKGLLGPLGTGFLYLAPGMEPLVEPLRRGGTGTRSDEAWQPESMPDRYESGNANVPGLAGLAAGLEYVLERSPAAIHAREFELVTRLMHALQELPAIRMYGPPLGEERVGLVAFTVEGYDPREFASLLDSNFGIQVRAGLHCAPLIHKRLGAWPTGTVRLSVGPFTTDDDIEQTLAAVREIVAS
jgi:cysteine desulfurase family protein